MMFCMVASSVKRSIHPWHGVTNYICLFWEILSDISVSTNVIDMCLKLNCNTLRKNMVSHTLTTRCCYVKFRSGMEWFVFKAVHLAPCIIYRQPWYIFWTSNGSLQSELRMQPFLKDWYESLSSLMIFKFIILHPYHLVNCFVILLKSDFWNSDMIQIHIVI